MLINRLLNRLFRLKREAIKQKYNRVLPFNELMTDRWEKASYLRFGKGTSVYDSAMIYGDVTVGENTWIGPFTILDGSGTLKIGSNCSISAGVHIYTHDTVQWAISGGKEKYEYGEVIIGNNCYIAPNVVIARGVHIGDGCIIGANSFINKSFTAGKKIAGNPGKEIEDGK